MQAVILAGGVGSRLSEETVSKPKPMVEIGGDPILLHILKHYAHYGHNEFIVVLGYRGEVVKQYFTQYAALTGEITVSTRRGILARAGADLEDWTLHLVDTGLETGTGGRMRRIAHLLDGTFMMTFGDGVSDVDIDRLVAFHRSHGRLATITAVRPPARFGHVELEATSWPSSPRSHRPARAGSTAATWSWSPSVLDYIDE